MKTDDIIKSRMNTSRDQIAAFCKRWQVTELGLFGSVFVRISTLKAILMYW